MSGNLTSFRAFPILTAVGGGRVPWAMLTPHEKQALRNHDGQSLEVLASRGGMSWGETLCVLRDERAFDHLLPEPEAKPIVLAMAEEWKKAHA